MWQIAGVQLVVWICLKTVPPKCSMKGLNKESLMQGGKCGMLDVNCLERSLFLQDQFVKCRNISNLQREAIAYMIIYGLCWCNVGRTTIQLVYCSKFFDIGISSSSIVIFVIVIIEFEPCI